MNYQALIWKLIQSYYFVRLFRKLFQDCKCELRFLMPYYFIGIITYPYKYGYGQYRVIFPSTSILRLPMLLFATKTPTYAPIEDSNVYSLGNWAMSCCLTSDALSFPLNLQYNSLPIEKTARVPYSPQLMYLILPFFTLLFYKEKKNSC